MSCSVMLRSGSGATWVSERQPSRLVPSAISVLPTMTLSTHQPLPSVLTSVM